MLSCWEGQRMSSPNCCLLWVAMLSSVQPLTHRYADNIWNLQEILPLKMHRISEEPWSQINVSDTLRQSTVSRTNQCQEFEQKHSPSTHLPLQHPYTPRIGDHAKAHISSTKASKIVSETYLLSGVESRRICIWAPTHGLNNDLLTV